jgi:hypothetical protein
MASFNARFGRGGPSVPTAKRPIRSAFTPLPAWLRNSSEVRKSPQPVLVIDHMEENPGDD